MRGAQSKTTGIPYHGGVENVAQGLGTADASGHNSALIRPSATSAQSKPVKKPVPPTSGFVKRHSRRLLALPMGRRIHISANRSALQDRADSTGSLVSNDGCARRNQRRQQCKESCKSSYSHRRIVLAEFPNLSDRHRSVLRKRATAKDGIRPVGLNNRRQVCGLASSEDA